MNLFKECNSPNEEYVVDPKRPQNTCKTYGCYGEFQCPGSSKSGDCYCKPEYARLVMNGPCTSITKNTKCASELPPTPGIFIWLVKFVTQVPPSKKDRKMF